MPRKTPPPGATRAPESRRERVALGSVLALALALRLTLWLHRQGPLWLEEDLPHQLGLSLWGFERGEFDPNPHYALWPHLSVYFHFALQAARYLAGRALGDYAGIPDFRAAVLLDPGPLRATAMLAAIALGLAVIWLAARLARRRVGPWAGPWVALVLALDPIHVRHSLIVSPDMLLALFVLLGLFAALDVRENGRLADSLRGGLWMGLGTACKYSPALLAGPLLVAHLRGPRGAARRRPARGGGEPGRPPGAVPRLGGALLAAVVAFVAASPFTLLDLTQNLAKVHEGVGAVTGGHFGAARLPGAVQYGTAIMPGALGWPLWLLLSAALAWVALRRGRDHAVLLSFLLLYALIFAALPTVFPRYVVPALPPALVLGAAAAHELWRRVPLRRWAAGAGIAALVGLAAQCVGFMRDYLLPDTRALARGWILEHARDRDLMSAEYLGPELPSRIAYDVVGAARGVSPARFERLRRGPAYWVGTIPLTLERPESTTPYYDLRLFLDLDWVIVNDGVRARFLADTVRFPVHHAFYRALERSFVAEYVSPATGVTGPRVWVYRPPAAGGDSLEAQWMTLVATQPSLAATWPPGRLAQVYAARAQMRSQSGRHAAAASEWRRALRWPQAQPEWWLQLAASAEAAGDARAAREARERGYALNPALRPAPAVP